MIGNVLYIPKNNRYSGIFMKLISFFYRSHTIPLDGIHLLSQRLLLAEGVGRGGVEGAVVLRH